MAGATGGRTADRGAYRRGVRAGDLGGRAGGDAEGDPHRDAIGNRGTDGDGEAEEDRNPEKPEETDTHETGDPIAGKEGYLDGDPSPDRRGNPMGEGLGGSIGGHRIGD
jgi:hypothetical protein